MGTTGRAAVRPPLVRARLLRLTAAVALIVSLSSTAQGEATSSDNIRVVQSFALPTANEIEFGDSRVYVAGFGDAAGSRVHAFEIRRGSLHKTGALVCGGVTDVAALAKGFVALGLQRGGTECNAFPQGGVPGYVGGVHVANMTKPARPSFGGSIAIPGGVHTLTRYPGKPYVYTAMGGADAWAAFGGTTHIVDVSDPDEPSIAATYTARLNPAGCHDILFEKIAGKLIGFCPGAGGTEIWDASRPLAPKPVGRMLLPTVQLPHRVAVSSDGKVAAISDEAYAGHACRGGAPLGAMWFYDISDLADPKLLGYHGPQRGELPVGIGAGNRNSCTAHNFNFIPDSRTLVISWTAGGTQVLDVSDPAVPKELAYYRPDGAVHMSAYSYRGSIYVADMGGSLDVLRFRPGARQR